MLCSFPSLTKYVFSRINLFQELFYHNNDYTRNKYYIRIMCKTSKGKNIKVNVEREMHEKSEMSNGKIKQQLNYEVRK